MNKANASLLILLIAAASMAAYMSQDSRKSDEALFEEWKSEHGLMLNLSPSENAYRFNVFKKNVEEINEHNNKLGNKYTKGINKFTAFTQEEFISMFLTSFKANQIDQSKFSDNQMINIDWVSYGAVSPAKNQGTCLASYAFSTVGGIQGISVIFYKTQQQYSAQQIVDCSGSYGNTGCNGGNMENSYNYVSKVGINTQAAYPYVAKYGSCRAASGLFKIKGYIAIKGCSELEFALATRPISVAVDGRNFRSYSSGIFDNCGTTVSLAGLAVSLTDTFWRVKLSWGANFGENGYIRLAKANNICGICLYASYPIPA